MLFTKILTKINHIRDFIIKLITILQHNIRLGMVHLLLGIIGINLLAVLRHPLFKNLVILVIPAIEIYSKFPCF